MHRQRFRTVGLARNHLIGRMDRVIQRVMQSCVRPSWKAASALFAHITAIEEVFRPSHFLLIIYSIA